MRNVNFSTLVNIAIDEAREHGRVLAELEQIDDLHEGELAAAELEVDDLETQLLEAWEERDDALQIAEIMASIVGQLGREVFELKDVADHLNDEMIAMRKQQAVLCNMLGLPEFSTTESMVTEILRLKQHSYALRDIENKKRRARKSKRKSS